MLSHIGHSQVGVLPDCALMYVQLADQGFHHGRLAGSVGAQDCNAAVQGALQRHVADDVLGHARVPDQEHT